MSPSLSGAKAYRLEEREGERGTRKGERHCVHVIPSHERDTNELTEASLKNLTVRYFLCPRLQIFPVL